MANTIIVDHKQQGSGTSYGLKSDVLEGFREAVRNNQVSLAMEYLRFVVDELLIRVSTPAGDTTELENRIATLEATVEELKASLAPARRVTKKAVDENEQS